MLALLNRLAGCEEALAAALLAIRRHDAHMFIVVAMMEAGCYEGCCSDGVALPRDRMESRRPLVIQDPRGEMLHIHSPPRDRSSPTLCVLQ